MVIWRTIQAWEVINCEKRNKTQAHPIKKMTVEGLKEVLAATSMDVQRNFGEATDTLFKIEMVVDKRRRI
jgi:hypothetical protein